MSAVMTSLNRGSPQSASRAIAALVMVSLSCCAIPSSRVGGDPVSQSHIQLVHQLIIREIVARAAFVLDAAVHDHVAAVGDAHRLVEILLRHEHREAVRLLELLD